MQVGMNAPGALGRGPGIARLAKSVIFETPLFRTVRPMPRRQSNELTDRLTQQSLYERSRAAAGDTALEMRRLAPVVASDQNVGGVQAVTSTQSTSPELRKRCGEVLAN